MISTGTARGYAPSFNLRLAQIAAKVRPSNPRAFGRRAMTWDGCLLTLAPNLDVCGQMRQYLAP